MKKNRRVRSALLKVGRPALFAFALGLIFAASISSAQTTSTQFVRLSGDSPLACAVRSRDMAVLPARIASGRVPRAVFVDRIWIRNELRKVRVNIRQLGRKTNPASQQKRSALRLREQTLNTFVDRCRGISRLACGNNVRDPFETEVDCGGICSTACSTPGTTPLPELTIQPAPIRTPTAQPTPNPTTNPTGTPAPLPSPTWIPTTVPTPTPLPSTTPSPSLVNEECSDGIDNDLDGQTDMGAGDLAAADFGCFGPNNQETKQDYGFTLLVPSSDTRFVFVSSSEGDDANSGLSALAPKRTLSAAFQLIRNGSPDWLLLKRGDTFDGGDWRQRLGRTLGSNLEGDYTWNKSGRSTTERMVISSYGVLNDRPLLISRNAPGATNAGRVGLNITNQRHLFISGLDFYAQPCDPDSTSFQDSGCAVGIQLYSQVEDVILEDNRVRFFGSGINIQDANDPGQPPRADQRWNDIVLRRNVIHNSYHHVAHSQGLYMAGAGRMRITENILFRNGWNDSLRMIITPAAFNESLWRSVTDGRVNVVLNGTTYPLTAMDFSQVRGYAEVAAVIENKLLSVVPTGVTASLRWNGRQIVLRSNLPSTSRYNLTVNSSGGTNLGASNLLNIFSSGGLANPRHTAATVFNRNMYLTKGYSNTTVDGNITARGASGGIQLRMGGQLVGNLTLAEPVGMSVGHAENPVEVPFTAYIADNVTLGASNIGDTPMGFGIGFGGQTFTVERNIIAHNEEGTGNTEALFCDTDNAIADRLYANGVVQGNIVYNWRSPSLSGAAFASRHRAFSNILVDNNYFIQPFGGAVVGFSSVNALTGISYGANTFFASGGLNPATPFSVANQQYNAAQFQGLVGGSFISRSPNFVDPQRTIATYMEDFGLGVESVDGFMAQAITQSRHSWRPEFSAQRVNQYIREGFVIANGGS